MRTLVCIGILLTIAAAFFAIHEFVSGIITSMFQLAVGSMLIAVSLTAFTLRWTERSEPAPENQASG
jgi:hypothetical protein